MCISNTTWKDWEIVNYRMISTSGHLRCKYCRRIVYEFELVKHIVTVCNANEKAAP